MLQGTLYPDVIESMPPPGKDQKHSHMIKSHHNVGGLPKDLQFTLIEPLRELFKACASLLRIYILPKPCNQYSTVMLRMACCALVLICSAFICAAEQPTWSNKAWSLPKEIVLVKSLACWCTTQAGLALGDVRRVGIHLHACRMK